MPLVYLLCTLGSQRLPAEPGTAQNVTGRALLVTRHSKVEGESGKHEVSQLLIVGPDAHFPCAVYNHSHEYFLMITYTTLVNIKVENCRADDELV